MDRLQFVLGVWHPLAFRKKRVFFLYSSIPSYKSLCVLYILPQVLIVDLCADKFLQEVSEITGAVTQGYMPGKGTSERKWEQDLSESWYSYGSSSGWRSILHSFLTNREGNKLRNPCCKTEIVWGAELCEAEDAAYLSLISTGIMHGFIMWSGPLRLFAAFCLAVYIFSSVICLGWVSFGWLIFLPRGDSWGDRSSQFTWGSLLNFTSCASTSQVAVNVCECY